MNESEENVQKMHMSEMINNHRERTIVYQKVFGQSLVERELQVGYVC